MIIIEKKIRYSNGMKIVVNNAVVGAPGLDAMHYWLLQNPGKTEEDFWKFNRGTGIDRIELTNTLGLIDTYTIYYEDGQTQNYFVKNGEKGETGKAFVIAKTYTSIAAMNADLANMQEGDFVMLQTDVNEEDNAKLFTKEDNAWVFISDFSGASGIQGEKGVGIANIVKTNTAGLVDTYTITYSDSTTDIFHVTNGAQGIQGQQGVSISSVAKTSTNGLVDTYTITFSNATTTTYNVTNGSNAISWNFKGSVATYANLPTTGLSANDAYLVLEADSNNIQRLYIYNGTTFPANGQGLPYGGQKDEDVRSVLDYFVNTEITLNQPSNTENGYNDNGVIVPQNLYRTSIYNNTTRELKKVIVSGEHINTTLPNAGYIVGIKDDDSFDILVSANLGVLFDTNKEYEFNYDPYKMIFVTNIVNNIAQNVVFEESTRSANIEDESNTFNGLVDNGILVANASYKTIIINNSLRDLKHIISTGERINAVSPPYSFILGVKEDDTFDVLVDANGGAVIENSRKHDFNYDEYKTIYVTYFTDSTKYRCTSSRYSTEIEIDAVKKYIDYSISQISNTSNDSIYLADVGFNELNTELQNTAIFNQAFIDAKAQKKNIIIPAGVFRVGNVQVKGGVGFKGQDKNTLLITTTSNPTFNYTEAEAQSYIESNNIPSQYGHSNQGVEIGYFIMSGTGVATNAFILNNMAFSNFNRIYAMDYLDYIYDMKGVLLCEFNDLQLCGKTGMGGGVRSTISTNNLFWSNHVLFNNCKWRAVQKVSVDWSKGAGIHFNNCDWEHCGTSGDTTTGILKFRQMSTEDPANGNKGLDFSMTGCWIEVIRGGFMLDIAESKGRSSIRNSSILKTTIGDVAKGIINNNARILIDTCEISNLPIETSNSGETSVLNSSIFSHSENTGGTYTLVGELDIEALEEYVENGTLGADYTEGDEVYNTSFPNTTWDGYVFNRYEITKRSLLKSIDYASSTNVQREIVLGFIDQNNKFIVKKSWIRDLTIGINNIALNEILNVGEYIGIKETGASKTADLFYENNPLNNSYQWYTAGVNGVVTKDDPNTYPIKLNLQEYEASIIATKEELSIVKSEITSLSNKLTGYFTHNGQKVNLIFNSDGSVSWAEQSIFGKVLHLGNSILKHSIQPYWWGLWGMASSTRENDYAHKFNDFIGTITQSHEENIADWEANLLSYNLSSLNSITTTDLDLIVIRLGENVQNIADFETAYNNLITYLKARCPNARIVIGGQFWSNAPKEAIIQNVATSNNLTYVQLNQFDNATNKSFIGAQVYGDDGQWHSVNNQGVADHPNDTGMLNMATTLFNAL